MLGPKSLLLGKPYHQIAGIARGKKEKKIIKLINDMLNFLNYNIDTCNFNIIKLFFGSCF